MDIITRPLPNRKSRAAFRGPLCCPLCDAGARPDRPRAKWKFVEKISPCRIRYQCKHCGQTIQYDFSNNDDFLRQHPYDPYARRSSKFRNFINRLKFAKTIR